MEKENIEKEGTTGAGWFRLSSLRAGDIVMSRGALAKVLGVRTDFDGNLGGQSAIVLCDNTDVWHTCVEPVELNQKILEANGFGISEDLSYGILRTSFSPYGDGGVQEFEDYAVVDLSVPQASVVKHQYLVEREGCSPSLLCKTYEGEIRYVHELQSIMNAVGCVKKLNVTEEMLGK